LHNDFQADADASLIVNFLSEAKCVPQILKLIFGERAILLFYREQTRDLATKLLRVRQRHKHWLAELQVLVVKQDLRWKVLFEDV
jgi:hypothetical protein